MSTEETRQPDDAELDAFLEGGSDLSRRLKRLSQPSPPAQVSAAVLANIEAALAREKAASAANDDALPDAARNGRPRAPSRWRMPLAFAASVLLGVMIHLQWRTSQDPSEAAVAQRPAQAAFQSLPEETPPVADAAPAVAAKPAAQPASPPARLAKAEKEVPEIATAAAPSASDAAPEAPLVVAQAAEPAAPVQTVVTTGIRASLQQSLNVKRRATTDVQVVTAEDVGQMPDKNVVDSLRHQSGFDEENYDPRSTLALEEKPHADADHESKAAAPALARGLVAPASTTEESDKAKAWLTRIEKKIDLGQDSDALEEWTRFRKAYPDFEVPNALAEKIKALQQE